MIPGAFCFDVVALSILVGGERIGGEGRDKSEQTESIRMKSMSKSRTISENQRIIIERVRKELIHEDTIALETVRSCQ